MQTFHKCNHQINHWNDCATTDRLQSQPIHLFIYNIHTKQNLVDAWRCLLHYLTEPALSKVAEPKLSKTALSPQWNQHTVTSLKPPTRTNALKDLPYLYGTHTLKDLHYHDGTYTLKGCIIQGMNTQKDWFTLVYQRLFKRIGLPWFTKGLTSFLASTELTLQ